MSDLQGEGVAFRGRAMVELKTIGGALPEIPVEDIASEDILKVQVGTMSSLPSQLWAILSAQDDSEKVLIDIE